MSLLHALTASGCLRALDHALATSLRRLDPATPDAVLAAAALASRAVAQGHSALRLDAIDALLDAIAPQRARIGWPELGVWLEQLRGSPWVADADAGARRDATPLVLEHGRLYLHRYWNYEVRLARALRLRAAPPQVPKPAATLRARLREWFDGGDPDQALAVLLALSSPLALITGGPGTGKTSTVAALLILLREQALASSSPPPRIALAAPTGKAAARLTEALDENLERWRGRGRIDATDAQALRIQAQTVHRLLGWRANRVRFRHDADEPLRADVVIVDESSMIDLPLMCKLVEAVAPSAKLVLLGDRDQLAAVETGDVLTALCDAAGDGRRFPAGFAEEAAGWIGAPVAATQESLSVLSGHRVELAHGHRPAAGLDLPPLAAAVRDGDADTAIDGLRGHRFAGIGWHADGERALSAWLRESALPTFRAIAQEVDPALALRLARTLRILTAVREGPAGSEDINAWIASAMHAGAESAYFPGRLLIVGENSHRLGLFNGDTGVVQRDDNGSSIVWFDSGEGMRAFAPGQLPAHASAWALTVHKAQGSEFDRVVLALPDRDVRVLGRELLYTGITRCRSRLDLWAREEVLRLSIERRNRRESGLSTRFAPVGGAAG